MRLFGITLVALALVAGTASACVPGAVFAPACAPCVQSYAVAAPVYAVQQQVYAAPAVSYATSYSYAPAFAPAISYGASYGYGRSLAFAPSYSRGFVAQRAFVPSYGFNSFSRGFAAQGSFGRGFNRSFNAFDIAAGGGAVANVNIQQPRGLFGGGGLFGRRASNINVQAVSSPFGGAAANVDIGRSRGLFRR